MLLLLKDKVITSVPDSTKFCKDCKYCKKDVPFTSYCTYDSYNFLVDPVNGDRWDFKRSCLNCRSDVLINGCGPLGVKWEPEVV